MSLGRGLGSLITKKVNPTLASVERKIEEKIDEKGLLLQIPVEQIEVNPYQPRKEFSHKDLEELVSSIKIHGIIIPLIVTRLGKDRFELIAGERRLRSAKILELKKVPAIVRDAKDQEKLELALIENVQRQNLNPIEEAISYKKLIDEFNLTQDDVGKKIGKSRPAVANALRLLDLPEEIQKALAEQKITEGHARTILRFASPEEQVRFLKKILVNQFSVRDAELQSKKIKVKGHERIVVKNPVIEDYKQKLRDALGTKIEIEEKKGKGKIVIHFFSGEELSEITKKIIE